MIHTNQILRVTFAFLIATIGIICAETGRTSPSSRTQKRPNILCLTSEDMSPMLGCYGDTYAKTPNIDALAAKGWLFNNVWSNAPACSPARTTLISGMYATTTGGTSHRDNGGSFGPDFLKFYPLLMQELGYYTTNNSKEDYNIKPVHGKGWHASKSAKAQWYNRPNENTPFLAIYNYFETHESRLDNFKDPSDLTNDPKTAPLYPYLPKTPAIKNQVAKHYDTIGTLDQWVRKKLKQLEERGAAEDTIIFFYSDHGTCLPGGKRYVGNKGQRIPLIMYFPPKWEHLAPPGYTAGGKSDELVSFVDFAPTLLSLAGVKKPAWHHGRAFAGQHYEQPPSHLHGYTDRMGERTWLTRSVFDGRYVYIRNYRPDQPHLIRTAYQYEETFLREWEARFYSGELSEAEAKFWMPQGPEELYDLQTDPHELTNLINEPSLSEKANELRKAHLKWRDTHGDLAFLTEGVRREIRDKAGNKFSDWDLLQDPTHYPKKELLDVVDRASLGTPADLPKLLADLDHKHPSIRHWALIGLMLQGRETVRENEPAILARLSDPSPWVRATSAQVLATHGTATNQTAALDYLFAQCQEGGKVKMNSASERKYLAHMQALDQVPFIPESYKAKFKTFEDSSGWTQDFKFHIHRNFHTQYNNPLAAFRHKHGLDRFGADDSKTELREQLPPHPSRK